MEMGLGVLGLAPATFWAMTPRELRAALSGKLGMTGERQAPTRTDLETLMQQYPD